MFFICVLKQKVSQIFFFFFKEDKKKKIEREIDLAF